MAAQDRDNAMSGLLRQSLQADKATQGECLSPDILAAYYERSLASDEMSRCEDHVSRCFGCREQLAALARTDRCRKSSLVICGCWIGGCCYRPPLRC